MLMNVVILVGICESYEAQVLTQAVFMCGTARGEEFYMSEITCHHG